MKFHLNYYLEDDENSHTKKKVERDNNLIWIGEWFGVVFSTLQETCDFTEDTLDLIRSLKIFVLCDGSFVSLKEQTVFFPIEADMVKSKKSSKWKLISTNVLASEISTTLGWFF